MHIVLDGWTSPLIWSYLGIVLIWYDRGHILRAILEFTRYDKFSIVIYMLIFC